MPNTKNNTFLAVAVLTLTTLACNALLPLPTQDSAPTQIIEPIFTQPQNNLPQTEDAVPRVTVEEAKAALDSGAAIIVDVRSADSFALSHVAGAISIPLGYFESDIASIDLDKEQWIITYCT